MFGMCIDESGQEQTLPCAEATLRPCPVTAVCVLSGHPVLEWSHQLLVKTCQTLANTVKYFTRPLSIQALLHGMPSNFFNILLVTLNVICLFANTVYEHPPYKLIGTALVCTFGKVSLLAILMFKAC